MSASPRGLAVTYHAIASGPPPLYIDPSLLERHVEVLVEARVTALTVSELADALRSGSLPERAVAITFDDGFASIAESAAPVLARHGLRATVFAVADHVGGSSDWSTQPASAPRLPLLDRGGLGALAAAGWEIGSHGRTHRPLGSLDAEGLRDELGGSRSALEDLLGVPVRSFAFPYGSIPDGAADALIEAGYAAACTTRPGHVTPGADPLALPRVDAHYLRSPARLRRAAGGGDLAYLAVRRVASRVRRLVASDHRAAP
jgi:peptidoglycan/xylan/chitin deacetylase (PgdA/CDA1 family)